MYATAYLFFKRWLTLVGDFLLSCAANVGRSECTGEPDGKAYFLSRHVLLDEGGKI
jgi:hypothetical protein